MRRPKKPPALMGVDDDQLLVIQNDLRERLKARDEARERAVTRKLHELEQKHEFANSEFLKHFAEVSQLLMHNLVSCNVLFFNVALATALLHSTFSWELHHQGVAQLFTIE